MKQKDQLGQAYEQKLLEVITSANKAGEFFTPFELCQLVGQLVGKVDSVYDPAAGSGSLLMSCRAKSYHAQELNATTCNLLRQNIANIDLVEGDVLGSPGHLGQTFDAVVSNPPYSQKWTPPLPIDKDPRFAYGLAPKSKADWAFLSHCVHHIDSCGVFIVFPGILYRGGSEAVIRRGFLEANLISAVVQLPPNLFMRTSIGVTMLIIDKHKTNRNIIFIDASNEIDGINEHSKNRLKTDKILNTLRSPKHELGFCTITDQVDQEEAILSVNYYIEAVPEDPVDIEALNEEVRRKNKRLRKASVLHDRFIEFFEGKKDVPLWVRIPDLQEKLLNGEEPLEKWLH